MALFIVKAVENSNFSFTLDSELNNPAFESEINYLLQFT
jgi:hypothetical protein